MIKELVFQWQRAQKRMKQQANKNRSKGVYQRVDWHLSTTISKVAYKLSLPTNSHLFSIEGC
ncbi:unnamed protein product [Cuscuta epithymum]|uniref:Uncharacterized protein n=1 Tax=Cuscuta epithymum TaxID=186058 RepID=A0AAV0FE50_9ASTE|nr:unnamed protein product [Cuscuta epithymum]